MTSIREIFEEYGARIITCENCEEQTLRFERDLDRNICPNCGDRNEEIDWGEDAPDIEETTTVEGDGTVRHRREIDE